MAADARAVLGLVAAGLLAACSPRVDYDDTHYRCDESGTCPDGFSCVDGECLAGGPPTDAAPDDDDPPDAAFDPVTMLRAESDRTIVIPDDNGDGIVDQVRFDTPCAIADITVDVDITHDWPADLAIALMSPWQTEVLLHQPGGESSGDDIVGTYPTTLTPSESLDALAGEEGVGQWMLWVADVSDGDVGTLNGWAVTLWCE